MRHLGAVCFVSNKRVAPIFDQQPLLYLDLTVCWEFASWKGSGKEERNISRSFYTPSRIVSHMCFLRDLILVWLITERSMNTYIFRWRSILSGETKQGTHGRFTRSKRIQFTGPNSKELWGVLNFWSVVVLLRVEILGQELMSEIFRGLEAARNFLSSKFRERFRPNVKEADPDDRWRYAIRELCIRLVFHRTSAEGLHPSWPGEGRLGSLTGVLLGVGHLEGCTLHISAFIQNDTNNASSRFSIIRLRIQTVGCVQETNWYASVE